MTVRIICGYTARVGRTVELVVNMPTLGLPPEECLVTILGYVAEDGMLWVAPLGTPGPEPADLGLLASVRVAWHWARKDRLTGWALLGPVDDLPGEGTFGNIRAAYWAAILPGGS